MTEAIIITLAVTALAMGVLWRVKARVNKALHAEVARLNTELAKRTPARGDGGRFAKRGVL